MNYDRTPFETDKPGEECGVFGAYDFDGHDISSSIYYGLFALQHRGQESCGIAVSDTEGPKGKVDYYKDMGLSLIHICQKLLSKSYLLETLTFYGANNNTLYKVFLKERIYHQNRQRTHNSHCHPNTCGRQHKLLILLQ